MNPYGHVWSCDAGGQVVHSSLRGNRGNNNQKASESVGTIKLESQVSDATISADGRIAYVADGTNVLRRFDVSNGASVTKSSEIAFPARVTSVSHDDSSAWLASDDANRLLIGDVESTTPTTAVVLDKSVSPGAGSETATGRASYVAGTMASPLSDGSAIIIGNWRTSEPEGEAAATKLTFLTRAQDADLAVGIDESGRLLAWRGNDSPKEIAPGRGSSAVGRFGRRTVRRGSRRV